MREGIGTAHGYRDPLLSGKPFASLNEARLSPITLPGVNSQSVYGPSRLRFTGIRFATSRVEATTGFPPALYGNSANTVKVAPDNLLSLHAISRSTAIMMVRS